MAELLLDTCALIWAMEASLPASARQLLKGRVEAGERWHVSAISAWEIGMLNARSRLPLPTDPFTYFRKVMSQAGMNLLALTPEILIASSFLPGQPPRDPFDRILAATARTHEMTLMTRDRLLLAYAAAGHLSAVPC